MWRAQLNFFAAGREDKNCSDKPPQSAVQADCAPLDRTTLYVPHQHHQPFLNTGHDAGQAGHHHTPPIYRYHDVQNILCSDGDYHRLMRTENEEQRKCKARKIWRISQRSWKCCSNFNIYIHTTIYTCFNKSGRLLWLMGFKYNSKKNLLQTSHSRLLL